VCNIYLFVYFVLLFQFSGSKKEQMAKYNYGTL